MVTMVIIIRTLKHCFVNVNLRQMNLPGVRHQVHFSQLQTTRTAADNSDTRNRGEGIAVSPLALSTFTLRSQLSPCEAFQLLPTQATFKSS